MNMRNLFQKFIIKTKHNRKQAFALLYALIFITLILMTIAFLTTLTLSAIRNTARSKSTVQVYEVARSGIEDGIQQLKTNPSPTTLQRYYLADGETKREVGAFTTPPAGNRTQGYYELSFSGNTSFTVRAFAPWKKDYLSVTLLATYNTSAINNLNYIITQIGS